MNKVINVIKYLLFILSFVFIYIFIHRYKIYIKENYNLSISSSLIIFSILFAIIFILNVIDFFIKGTTRKSKGYNVLTIINIIAIIMTLYKALYDKSIPSNFTMNKDLFYENSYYGFNIVYTFSYFLIILLLINLIHYISSSRRNALLK